MHDCRGPLRNLKSVDTQSHLWLPFTQMAQFDASQRTFVRGEGNYLIDSQGRHVFDAVSSIWTTIHGHCRTEITQAIASQAAILDHATLLGATNPLAEALAMRLADLTGLDRAFFSSDGASAVEVALKIALQYWQNIGQRGRTRFVRLADSYHGDTAGAMSVSDIDLFKQRFGAVTFESLPYDRAGQIVSAPDIAAVIVEPIVQAAAGIRIVPGASYDNLKEMTPLLIVDEIATGFGRTGSMFAYQQLGLQPDIICLGKGITGGALALSATLVDSRVYQSFLGADSECKQLFHGHSYAGNPIACAAALASLDLFVTEETLAQVGSLSRKLAPQLQALRAHPRVAEVRQAGLMCAIELRTDARGVADALYARGFFTRPIGNAIQLVPPLSSQPAELSGFLAALTETLAA
ncbi:MAG: adenosylmethionine--8-amino-7-oxononanoate transaminase [Candidatus Baltobacteraceae bacterium]